MDQYLCAVQKVVEARKGLDEAIYSQEVLCVLDAQASETCGKYLVGDEALDQARADHEWERRQGGRLLFILATMQLKDEYDEDEEDGDDEEYDRVEALRLMGAKNVDARRSSAKQRRGVAARGRRKPVTERHYRRGMYQQMQRRLADQLYILISRPEVLKEALAHDGETAKTKYL